VRSTPSLKWKPWRIVEAVHYAHEAGDALKCCVDLFRRRGMQKKRSLWVQAEHFGIDCCSDTTIVRGTEDERILRRPCEMKVDEVSSSLLKCEA
jgi:hypothetical protein